MDATTAVICNNQTLMPKLRKNRRVESRWGLEYHAAVRNAVFGIPTNPYVPEEPPSSLKKDGGELDSLHVCTQCKDSFRFLRSFEEHNTRHSWILGFWCQSCFTPTCTHAGADHTTCPACVKLITERRSYLRRRGLQRRQKFGATKVFYNQCQFFAHLQSHNMSSVDMGDLMLMPLPTNLDSNWSPELDVVCEALMEHAFVLRIHIMDWLKAEDIENNWWQLATSKLGDNEVVATIIKSYEGRRWFNPIPTRGGAQINIDLIESATEISNNERSSSTNAPASISGENAIEEEDNPCIISDIAFVDCGPTSNYFEPEGPVNNISNKNSTIFWQTRQDSSNSYQPAQIVNTKTKHKKLKTKRTAEMTMSYGNTIITPKLEKTSSTMSLADAELGKEKAHQSYVGKTSMKMVPETSTVRVNAEARAKNMDTGSQLSTESLHFVQSDISGHPTKMQIGKNKSNQNTLKLAANSASQILTFQSSKPVNISKLITQLPSHFINNKKIVFIGQNPDSMIVRSKQETPTSLGKGVKLQEQIVSSDGSQDDGSSTTKPKTKSNSAVGKMAQLSFPGKVIYQNGKRFIIKQTPSDKKNAISVPKSAKTTKKIQATKETTENRLLTPVPSKSSDSENTSTPDMITTLQSDVPVVAQLPSSSESPNSSNRSVQSKQSSTATKNTTVEGKDSKSTTESNNVSYQSLSFRKGKDENLYLNIQHFNQKLICTITDTYAMIMKCKKEMLNEFFEFSYSELRRRYDHIQNIGEEVSKVTAAGDEKMINENLKAVNILKHVLKQCIDKYGDSPEYVAEDDAPLNEWESGHEKSKKRPKCSSCNKILKPSTYIPGFSKPEANDIYCACYRHVCHQCNTYETGSSRFKAHRNYHKKQPPHMCSYCYRKYATFKSLECHVWSVCYPMLRKNFLGCKICDIIGFGDIESIARHFAVMHSHTKIACDVCYLVLPSYTEYKKHKSEAHSSTEHHTPIRLVLCKLGRCIVRYEDYMSHMEKHLVVQKLVWLKCPFCKIVRMDMKTMVNHFKSAHFQRLPEIISLDTLMAILPEKDAQLLGKTHLRELKHDETVVPKIVNTRTITSEVFERGAQEVEVDANVTSARSSKSGKNAGFTGTSEPRTAPRILEVRSIVGGTARKTISTIEKPAKVSASKGDRQLPPPSKEVRSSAGDNSIDDFPSTSKTLETSEETASEQSLRTREEKSFKSSTMNKEAITMKVDKSEVVPTALRPVEYIQITTASLTSKDQSNAKRPASQNSEESTKSDAPCDEKKMDVANAVETVDISGDAQPEKQMKNAELSPMLKPPPLARIPQRVLKPFASVKTGQEAGTVHHPHQKTSRQPPRRIALNGPTNSKEDSLNFSCHLCRELINTSWSVIRAHYTKNHSDEYSLSIVEPKLLRMSAEFVNTGYKDLLGNRKRKTDSIPMISKRRRRWTPKKYPETKTTNSPGLGLCVKQETAEDGEGNFKCKKCNQRCADMQDLREHIASNHRIKGRYLICLECGENFVVAPSLQMHLKAFHGIDDPITYMTQNTSYAPDNVDDAETEGKTTEANQCYVCMAVFEDKAAVDKHLRVHGMAFLNRKRIEARNALKSPEKRSDSEEGSEKSPKGSPKESPRKDNPATTILEKINATI